MTKRRLASLRYWLLCLGLAWVYLVPLPSLPKLNNPNENSRVYLTIALWDHHSTSLNGPVGRFGWTNDLAIVPTSGGKGKPSSKAHGGLHRSPSSSHHYASVKGPFVSLWSVPFYGLYRAIAPPKPGPRAPLAERRLWYQRAVFWLQLWAIKLPCLLALLLLERWSRPVCPEGALRWAVVLALGLGTNYLAYASLVCSHALIGAVVGLLGLGLTRWGKTGSVWAWLGFGFAASLPTLLEYQGLFVSIGFLIWAFVVARGAKGRRGVSMGAFVAGAGVGACILMLYQWRAFGTPLTPGHQLLESKAMRADHLRGWFGLLPPQKAAFEGLLLDVGHGLFATSPWVLAVALLPLFWRMSHKFKVAPASAHQRVSFALACLSVLSVSMAVVWRGGWTIGPRYLGTTVGLLAVCLLVSAKLERALSVHLRGGLRAILAAGLGWAWLKIGALGLWVTTLPPALRQPLPDFLLPVLRRGQVPHHLFEIVGLTSALPPSGWPVYGALALGSVLVLGAMAWQSWSLPRGCRVGYWATLALALAVLVGTARWRPATTKGSQRAWRLMQSVWEPAVAGNNAPAR